MATVLSEAVPTMATKFFDLNRAPMFRSQNSQQAAKA